MAQVNKGYFIFCKFQLHRMQIFKIMIWYFLEWQPPPEPWTLTAYPTLFISLLLFQINFGHEHYNLNTASGYPQVVTITELQEVGTQYPRHNTSIHCSAPLRVPIRSVMYERKLTMQFKARPWIVVFKYCLFWW